jgi:hypothetical protein
VFVIRFILSMLALTSLLPISANLYALWRARRLESSGRRAEGECVNHYWPSGGYVGAVCEYLTESGEKASIKSDRYSVAPVEIGDAVEVLYDPQKHSRAKLAFEVENRVGFDLAFCSVIAVVFMACVVGLIFTF